jgi:hypothetical protein
VAPFALASVDQHVDVAAVELVAQMADELGAIARHEEEQLRHASAFGCPLTGFIVGDVGHGLQD